MHPPFASPRQLSPSISPTCCLGTVPPHLRLTTWPQRGGDLLCGIGGVRGGMPARALPSFQSSVGGVLSSTGPRERMPVLSRRAIDRKSVVYANRRHHFG